MDFYKHGLLGQSCLFFLRNLALPCLFFLKSSLAMLIPCLFLKKFQLSHAYKPHVLFMIWFRNLEYVQLLYDKVFEQTRFTYESIWCSNFNYSMIDSELLMKVSIPISISTACCILDTGLRHVQQCNLRRVFPLVATFTEACDFGQAATLPIHGSLREPACTPLSRAQCYDKFNGTPPLNS